MNDLGAAIGNCPPRWHTGTAMPPPSQRSEALLGRSNFRNVVPGKKNGHIRLGRHEHFRRHDGNVLTWGKKTLFFLGSVHYKVNNLGPYIRIIQDCSGL